jgi:hypothetical protein
MNDLNSFRKLALPGNKQHKTLMKTQFVRLLTALVLSASLHQAAAQGTAFTYEGQLNNGIGQANGLYDLTFSLYNAANGGAQTGGAFTDTAVGVTNGLFTATMDFGAVFTGTPYWLQIGVRTNGNGAFTVLTPRQQLTPTPYAIFAETANAAGLSGTIPTGDFTGTYGSAVTLNNAGNSFVGNGTGLTGVNAGLLGGLAASSFWQTTGNAGTSPGANFLGTSDNEPLIFRANNQVGLQLQYASVGTSFPLLSFQYGINLIGGYWGNAISNGVVGGTIAGGGDTSRFGTIVGSSPNVVTGSYGTIGGGIGNTAGNSATVPGGEDNLASGPFSFAAGQSAQALHQGAFVWADSQGAVFASTTNDEFSVRANNGVHIQADKGIHLNAADRPIIVRDWDVFTANAPGYKAGIGRWGLFMEPTILTIGIPGDNVGARYFQVAKYSTNGTPTMLVQVDQGGDLWVKNNLSTATLTIRGGSDLAEPFNITAGKSGVPQGAVVVIDDQNPGQLKLTDQSYDTHVAGVVSGANGIHPGIQMHQQGLLEGGQNVALSGRVYVQADTSNGAIEPGDLLTTSSNPGRAMRVSDHTRAAGAILGKAMSELKNGQGMVLVLVTLQ